MLSLDGGTLYGVFDGVDLVPIQMILSLLGAVLSMWYMQITGACYHESRAVRCLRRFGIFLVAAALLWSVNYAYYRAWQPWPPYVLLLLGLNVALIAAILRDHEVRKRSSIPAE